MSHPADEFRHRVEQWTAESGMTGVPAEVYVRMLIRDEAAGSGAPAAKSASVVVDATGVAPDDAGRRVPDVEGRNRLENAPGK